MKTRRQRPLFLIDIGVPRDVERVCGELESVFCMTSTIYSKFARENITARERRLLRVRA